MKRDILAVLTCAAALIMPAHRAGAAKPTTNILDLGTLGGGFSEAFGVNNDPAVTEVVGSSTTATEIPHAFFWTTGHPMVDLGGIDGRESFAYAINNSRQVAGVSGDANRRRWAVVWTSADDRWSLEKLPTVNDERTGALSLNNGGPGTPVSIVGVIGGQAAVWTKSATEWSITLLGRLPGDTTSSAHGVNDFGEVVGASSDGTDDGRAFLWTANGGMRMLEGLGGPTTAHAINDAGDVAGTSADASGNQRAVRWRSTTGWRIEDLGTLGGCCSAGTGINNSSRVAGFSRLGGRKASDHAFLTNGTRMTDLGVINRSSAARDVNDYGVAVGSSGVGSQLHAVLWRFN